jgi:hypothetical protein
MTDTVKGDHMKFVKTLVVAATLTSTSTLAITKVPTPAIKEPSLKVVECQSIVEEKLNEIANIPGLIFITEQQIPVGWEFVFGTPDQTKIVGLVLAVKSGLAFPEKVGLVLSDRGDCSLQGQDFEWFIYEADLKVMGAPLPLPPVQEDDFE